MMIATKRTAAPFQGKAVVRVCARKVSVVTGVLKDAKPAKLNQAAKKVLTAGEDIPAQQFKIGNRVVTLGFTKTNELFVGRAAMVGFAAALIGELLTGKGPMAQFGMETGIPLMDVDWIVLFVIVFNLIAAFAPARGRFVAEGEELEERPKGPIQDPSISLLQPKKFFGVSGFGFTKANELFVGRMAQLGFAFSLIGEAITGKGPLGQFGLETGIPLYEAEPLLLAFILFTLFAAINEGSGRFVEEK